MLKKSNNFNTFIFKQNDKSEKNKINQNEEKIKYLNEILIVAKEMKIVFLNIVKEINKILKLPAKTSEENNLKGLELLEIVKEIFDGYPFQHPLISRDEKMLKLILIFFRKQIENYNIVRKTAKELKLLLQTNNVNKEEVNKKLEQLYLQGHFFKNKSLTERTIMEQIKKQKNRKGKAKGKRKEKSNMKVTFNFQEEKHIEEMYSNICKIAQNEIEVLKFVKFKPKKEIDYEKIKTIDELLKKESSISLSYNDFAFDYNFQDFTKEILKTMNNLNKSLKAYGNMEEIMKKTQLKTVKGYEDYDAKQLVNFHEEFSVCFTTLKEKFKKQQKVLQKKCKECNKKIENKITIVNVMLLGNYLLPRLKKIESEFKEQAKKLDQIFQKRKNLFDSRTNRIEKQIKDAKNMLNILDKIKEKEEEWKEGIRKQKLHFKEDGKQQSLISQEELIESNKDNTKIQDEVENVKTEGDAENTQNEVCEKEKICSLTPQITEQQTEKKSAKNIMFQFKNVKNEKKHDKFNYERGKNKEKQNSLNEVYKKNKYKRNKKRINEQNQVDKKTELANSLKINMLTKAKQEIIDLAKEVLSLGLGQCVKKYSYNDIVYLIGELGGKYKGQNGSHQTYQIGDLRLQIYSKHKSGKKSKGGEMSRLAMRLAKKLICKGLKLQNLLSISEDKKDKKMVAEYELKTK